MEPKENLTDAPRYKKISRDILLSIKDRINVDLYFKRKIMEDFEEYVLFAKAGMGRLAFQKIASNPVGSLYIKEDNLENYTSLIESNLENILQDSSLEVSGKSKAVYDCAVDVIQNVFEDPRSGKNLTRSRDMVNHMVTFAVSEPGAVKSLLNIGKKDYYTFSHCVHVSVFATGLAKVFGITNKKDMMLLGLGTLLHDVGKTKIDDSILNKPGKLSPEEFNEIKKHPIYGYELLDGSIPVESLDVVLHHHERFDGTGYPDNLSRDQISLFAKISTLADVYDALTTNRCYAKARNPFEAIMIMKKEMLGHFEEDKFMAFIKMLGPGIRV
jgi:HD-GYP domain-containing protein (c-di-GMP phosphodiesterase class II)